MVLSSLSCNPEFLMALLIEDIYIVLPKFGVNVFMNKYSPNVFNTL